MPDRKSSPDAPLRTGRTTGSCATAAAMAGTLLLLTGHAPTEVDVPLPPGGTLTVPIARVEPEAGEGHGVRATVIKDGGDDPDATHGCEIQAVVTHSPETTGDLVVELHGGRGVGRATLPGLPVEVGRAAINPEPRKQIERGVRLAAGGTATGRISVVVEVPEGETIAQKTMNPRLGITGGISILGTQGIVKPFSHDAWQATIDEGLDVARALGLDHVVFSTGRRSERLYQELHPDTPDTALIQAADFFSFSMERAAEKGFARVTWSVFFGKLVKQAQAIPYTHAKSEPIDFRELARWCTLAGDTDHAKAIAGANTARQVLELIREDPHFPDMLAYIADRATRAAQGFGHNKPGVDYAVFDFDGVLLPSPPDPKIIS